MEAQEREGVHRRESPSPWMRARSTPVTEVLTGVARVPARLNRRHRPQRAVADFAVSDPQKFIVSDAYTRRGAPGLAIT